MKNSPFFIVLKIATLLVFAGRAWQHLFWDAPYRSFFWDEALLKPVIEGFFETPWHLYATNPVIDQNVQRLVFGYGILYAIATIAVLFTTKRTIKFTRFPIVLGSLGLLLLAILTTKEKFYHLAQFFEHSIQIGIPLALVYILQNHHSNNIHLLLKTLIALTFCAHGLYAIGVYPVPGNFVDLLINSIGCSEHQAITLLYIAGMLDLLLVPLLFFSKTSSYALWYATIWGLLTAFARVWANFDMDFILISLHQHLHLTLFRLAHGLVPLATLLLILKEKTHIEHPSDSKSMLYILLSQKPETSE